jgi:hypothetical protein
MEPSTDHGRDPEAVEGLTYCAKDHVPLEMGRVELTYQGHTFPVDALCCPVCGQPLIAEDMVKGKIREVEQTLEEK